MINEKPDGIIKGLSDECERLQKENKALKKKLSIALEGFDVIISMGESSANVVKRMQEAMEDCDKELPQDISRIKVNKAD